MEVGVGVGFTQKYTVHVIFRPGRTPVVRFRLAIRQKVQFFSCWKKIKNGSCGKLLLKLLKEYETFKIENFSSYFSTFFFMFVIWEAEGASTVQLTSTYYVTLTFKPHRNHSKGGIRSQFAKKIVHFFFTSDHLF